jgi:ADP-ribosylglycohydrolase
MNVEDRIRGAVYGQAVGDALGLGTEFLTKKGVREYYPQGLKDYDQIIQDQHRRRWKEGSWTDDTDQMLCILDSLIEKKDVEIQDIAHRLYRWASGGGMGLGRTVRAVLSSPGFLEDPHAAACGVWEQSGQRAAANGGVMRTSILGVWDYRDPSRVRKNAAAVCRITHFDPRCVGSCVIICLTISSLLSGVTDVSELIRQAYEEADSHDERIGAYLDKAQKSLEALELDEGFDPETGKNGKIGYTLKAMGSALWALKNATSFEDGLSRVIHEGGDADSNGAVAGAVLGAFFGYPEIPRRLVLHLRNKKKIESRVEKLIQLL